MIEEKKNKRSELDEIFDMEFPLFEMQATFDVSKHLGGVTATDELLELCHITENSKILDVGCGVGATASYIAKKYNVQITGVDKSERMIQQATKRVIKRKFTNLVELRVADATNLPFEDNSFDIVMTESVLSFVENKPKAIDEFVRVVKPSGYIGLNESILLNNSPPKEILNTLENSQWFRGKIMTASEWSLLLNNVGLKDLVEQIHPIKTRGEVREHIKRYGWRHFLGTIFKSIISALKSRKYREFVNETKSAPRDLPKYMGYGFFVGKKP
ncbi:MAG: class I SAM-dependent methyltransferase [Candidatus Hodarchaeota archaeon]